MQGSVEPTPFSLRALLPPRNTQPLLQDGAGSETGKPSWTRLWRSWGGRKGLGVGAAAITWGTRPVGHGGSLPHRSISPALVHGVAPKSGLAG